MHVASSTRYGPVNLTVVEMGEGKDAWVFLPFETGIATVHVLDRRYVYAYDSQRDWALFDGEARRRVIHSAPAAASKLSYIFCYSPKRRGAPRPGGPRTARGEPAARPDRPVHTSVPLRPHPSRSAA